MKNTIRRNSNGRGEEEDDTGDGLLHQTKGWRKRRQNGQMKHDLTIKNRNN
jgi:hypothetical protein